MDKRGQKRASPATKLSRIRDSRTRYELTRIARSNIKVTADLFLWWCRLRDNRGMSNDEFVSHLLAIEETNVNMVEKDIVEEPNPSEEPEYHTCTYRVKEEDLEGCQAVIDPEIVTEPRSTGELETEDGTIHGEGWAEDSGTTEVGKETQQGEAGHRRYHTDVLQEDEFADSLSEEIGATEDFGEAQLHVEEAVHRAYQTDSLQEEDNWTEDDNAKTMEVQPSKDTEYQTFYIKQESLDSDYTEVGGANQQTTTHSSSHQDGYLRLNQSIQGVTCSQQISCGSAELRTQSESPGRKLGIDNDSFRLLEEEPSLLLELFPLAGSRLKFKKCYHDFPKIQPQVPATAGNSSSDHPAPEGPAVHQHDATAHQKPSKNETKAMDIACILMADPCGERIIKEIEETRAVSAKSRCKMVRILVSYLIKEWGTIPAAAIKIHMAKSIITRFPALKDTEGEGYEHYFTKSRGKHSATGYLEERLKNVRRRMRQVVKTPLPLVASASTASSKLDENKKILLTEEEETDANDKKRWCQHNISPKEQVVEYMKDTSHLRRKEVMEGSKSVLTDWPRLLDSPAMIEEDFRSMYGKETSEQMTKKWTVDFSRKIVTYGLKQNALVEFILKEDGNDDHQAVLQILPLFLPSGQINKSGKIRLATSSEALAAFIDQKPVGTNLTSYLSSVVKDGDRPQPFVLVLGERSSPSQTYVIFQGRAIEAQSLLNGVDLCFKIMYVFNIEYQRPCRSTWEFLQKYIYNISDGKRYSYTSPAVRSLRAYLQSS